MCDVPAQKADGPRNTSGQRANGRVRGLRLQKVLSSPPLSRHGGAAIEAFFTGITLSGVRGGDWLQTVLSIGPLPIESLPRNHNVPGIVVESVLKLLQLKKRYFGLRYTCWHQSRTSSRFLF